MEAGDGHGGLVLALSEISREDLNRVGSKAATLGELLGSGFVVPEGYVSSEICTLQPSSTTPSQSNIQEIQGPFWQDPNSEVCPHRYLQIVPPQLAAMLRRSAELTSDIEVKPLEIYKVEVKGDSIFLASDQ